MSAVHVVVPDGIDDPGRPSGGNAYDRQVCDGLAASGWSVRERPVRGTWPAPDRRALDALATVLADIPDGDVVLVDGLVGSAAPEVLVPAARRLRVVVLVHMPLVDRSAGGGADVTAVGERAVLAASSAVVTTSDWTRRLLLAAYALDPARVRVVEPGVAGAALAAGTASGGNLLCVGALTPTKGHDVLLGALALVADLRWRCLCAGSLAVDPGFVDGLRREAAASGLADRVDLAGPLVGDDLARAYGAADLLVLASRAETYGMVVTEALARGLPAVVTSVGGLPETLAVDEQGHRPGLLVPAGDPTALAAALRRWLEDELLRRRLRRAAEARRVTLPSWDRTAAQLGRVLAEVAC